LRKNMPSILPPKQYSMCVVTLSNHLCENMGYSKKKEQKRRHAQKHEREKNTC